MECSTFYDILSSSSFNLLKQVVCVWANNSSLCFNSFCLILRRIGFKLTLWTFVNHLLYVQRQSEILQNLWNLDIPTLRFQLWYFVFKISLLLGFLKLFLWLRTCWIDKWLFSNFLHYLTHFYFIFTFFSE